MIAWSINSVKPLSSFVPPEFWIHARSFRLKVLLCFSTKPCVYGWPFDTLIPYFFNNKSTVSLNYVYYHTAICIADQIRIYNASFQQPSQCFLRAGLLEGFEKWSTMCRIHLYSPSGVVDISIKPIWKRRKTLFILTDFKGARTVWVCGFVFAKVLQCFRRNATSWCLMPKNCWFNAVKGLFLPEWIELVWYSWIMRLRTNVVLEFVSRSRLFLSGLRRNRSNSGRAVTESSSTSSNNHCGFGPGKIVELEGAAGKL